MSNAYLSTYLNDHLAGSVAALEMLAQLETSHRDTDMERVFASLIVDISADRDELLSLMGRLNIGVSTSRSVTGWLADKATQLKLRLDDPRKGALRLLESVEAVSLGIE